MPNLLLAFPNFDAASLSPWVDHGLPHELQQEHAARRAIERQQGLERWGMGLPELQALAQGAAVAYSLRFDRG